MRHVVIYYYHVRLSRDDELATEVKKKQPRRSCPNAMAQKVNCATRTLVSVPGEDWGRTALRWR